VRENKKGSDLLGIPKGEKEKQLQNKMLMLGRS